MNVYREPNSKTIHHDFMVYELYQVSYIMGIDLGSHHTSYTSYIIIPCHTYGYILGSLWNIVKVWANVPCKEHLGASGDDETAMNGMNGKEDAQPEEKVQAMFKWNQIPWKIVSLAGTQAMQFNTTTLYNTNQYSCNRIHRHQWVWRTTCYCYSVNKHAWMASQIWDWDHRFWSFLCTTGWHPFLGTHTQILEFPQFPLFKLPRNTDQKRWDFRMSTNGIVFFHMAFRCF